MTSPVPLLLFPGLMNDHRVWSPVLAAFGQGRQVIVARTHEHEDVREMARAALALVPDGRFAVAGFSLGGYVALEAWRQASQRIAGMALLDTGARPDTEEGRQVRMRMIQGLQGAAVTLDTVAAAFLPRILHASHVADAQLAAVLIAMAREVGPEGFVRQQRAAMARPDSRGLLAQIACPALVLCGREDQVTPPELSEEMAAAIPGADLVIVPECGHMSTLEQPAAVSRALAAWCGKVDSVRG